MSSSITYLSFPSPAKSLRRGVEHAQVQIGRLRRVRRLRSQRSARLARAGVATQHITSAVVHKFTRKLRVLFKGRRSSMMLRASSTVALLFADLKAKVVRTRAFAAIGRAVRRVLSRLRKLVPVKLAASLQRLTHAKLRQRRLLRVLLYWAAIAAARLARVRRQHRRRACAPRVAAEMIATILGKSVSTVAGRILAQQEQERRKAFAATIERAWRAFTAPRQDRRRRKHALAMLLTSAQSDLEVAEARGRLVQTVATRVAAITVASVAHELARRRAVCLLQRVWRGAIARMRVDAMRSAKKQKANRQLERDRVRRARAALLSGSPEDAANQKTIAMRVAARQEAAAVIKYPVVGTRPSMTMCRDSVHEPIARRRPPPYSSTSGARVMAVSCTKFEQIRVRRARVNPQNLWVAVPVSFNEIEEPRGGSPSRSASLKATFDWVPATLLSCSGTRDMRSNEAEVGGARSASINHD